jgi:hypothetical protein
MPEQECVLAADNPGIGQFSRNAMGGRAGFKLHQLFLRWPGGQQKAIGKPRCSQHQSYCN